MATERIIGVDFGTSTSVIRVKRYQGEQPVGDLMETKPVTFNMGSTMVPTLIQKLPSGGTYFGYDAEVPHRKAKTFQNFKIDIENPDEGIRRQARELTVEYFTYLAKSYRAQSDGGHLGEPGDKERTVISYPVKWSEETKDFMLRAAREAGFPHVEGIDEAQAAIQAVTLQNAALLTEKGYFKDGVPVNILLIDMGAGTTDLVLCRHTPGKLAETDILKTWPQSGQALFGGREVDELLKSYICQAMPEEGADIVLKKIATEKYKAWKEGTVSPALKRGESVDYFSELDNLLGLMDIDAEYSVDRAGFEAHAADYLRQFPDLVKGCLRAAGMRGDEVDLVILTGGHSQWYFVREMLSGKLDRFGKTGLGKIQADPGRVIPISRPQETVALGLVYGPPKTFPLRYDPSSRIRPVIAAGSAHAVAVKKDGAIITAGDNRYGQCNVGSWRDVVAIAVGEWHTVGLKKDGTVVATGVNDYGQCNVGNWQDIVAIAAGESHTVGLKKDGAVVATGENGNGRCNVGSWQDIVAIAAGKLHTVGLKKNGTVVDTLRPDDPHNAGRWRDVVAVAASTWWETKGLKKGGTVIMTVVDESEHRDVSSWRDIVAIALGHSHMVGLKTDGTVVSSPSLDECEKRDGGWQKTLAVGDTFIMVDFLPFDNYNKCNVSGWRDIVAITAGTDTTMGLKKDGTVIFAGPDALSKAVTEKQQVWKLF